MDAEWNSRVLAQGAAGRAGGLGRGARSWGSHWLTSAILLEGTHPTQRWMRLSGRGPLGSQAGSCLPITAGQTKPEMQGHMCQATV